jgi:hypothetical protein
LDVDDADHVVRATGGGTTGSRRGG